MDKKEQAVNQIIKKDGHCLNHLICEHCPFRQQCYKTAWERKGKFTPKEQRLIWAIDYLLEQEILS